MTDLTDLTIAQAIKGMKNKTFSATELTTAYLENIEKNKKYNAFVTECAQSALDSAKISDEKYLKGMNVYYAIIPDKNYYLGNDDYLKPDYNNLKQIMSNKLENFKYFTIIFEVNPI